MARVTASSDGNVQANYTGDNTILQKSNNNNNLRMPGHDVCKMSQMRACTHTHTCTRKQAYKQASTSKRQYARPCVRNNERAITYTCARPHTWRENENTTDTTETMTTTTDTLATAPERARCLLVDQVAIGARGGCSILERKHIGHVQRF